MALPCGIVVGNVNRVGKVSPWIAITDALTDARNDELPVASGKGYAVGHLVPIGLELMSTKWQERQVEFIAHYGVISGIEALRYLVVVLTNLLAKVAATGVYHHPKESLVIALQLDEVITTTQGAHLTACTGVLPSDDMERGYIEALWHVTLVLCFVVPIVAHGDAALDIVDQGH